jgi:hypothetical protein
MKAIIRGVTLVGVAAAFVALTVVHLAADVCVYKPPKVRRICGVIVGPDGAAVPGVEVTIFKDATTVVVSKTADAGEFNVVAPGFKPARYHLTLARPTSSCTNALRVEMDVGSLNCVGDTIRETKKPLVKK